MPAIQIRNVPPEVYDKLKNSSRQHHRSIAGEVLAILEAALGIAGEYHTAASIEHSVESVRETIEHRYGKTQSSINDIREDRER